MDFPAITQWIDNMTSDQICTRMTQRGRDFLKTKLVKIVVWILFNYLLEWVLFFPFLQITRFIWTSIDWVASLLDQAGQEWNYLHGLVILRTNVVTIFHPALFLPTDPAMWLSVRLAPCLLVSILMNVNIVLKMEYQRGVGGQ